MNEADADDVNTTLTSAFHLLIHIFHSVIKFRAGLQRTSILRFVLQIRTGHFEFTKKLNNCHNLLSLMFQTSSDIFPPWNSN